MSYIDSRDLQDEIDNLESEGDPLEGNPLDEDEKARRAELLTLRDEISEWYDGATLIPEDEFEDYAQELAEELDLIPRENRWPLYCIDWEWAARDLRHDYSSVELGGTTYLVRS